jgi:hypothetical protein
MVGTDPLQIDQLLVGGELRCPGCAGELRQYFPKGTDLSRHPTDELAAVALALNSRPARPWAGEHRAEAFNDHLLSLQQQAVATSP